MHIAILSNDYQMTAGLRDTIEEYGQRKFVSATVEVFSSIREFLITSALFDMLIIDDCFDRHNAVETARLVRTKDPKAALVLIAKNPDKVYDAFKVKVHRFYVKPVTQSMLFEALDAYRKDLFSYRIIIMKTEDGYRSFSSEEILGVEANGKDAIVHLGDKAIPVSTSFARIFTQLPDEFFYQTHRSYIINMKHIREFNSEMLKLDNGETVPLSRRRKVDFYIRYSEFVLGHSFL